LNTNKIILKLRSTNDQIVDQAFTFLYREYFPVIRSFIKNNNGTEDDAADIFQDALIVLYDKVRDENFVLTCAIKTYIYSICKNLWLKRLKKKKKTLLKSEGFETINLDPNMDEILENREDVNLVATLLNKIGGDAKRLLIYFYFDGLKTEEVTLKMGYANDQVTRNKKSKCIKKLREMIKQSAQLKQYLP